MAEFWSQYGSLILIGAFLFILFRMHGRGGCCGGDHKSEHNKKKDLKF